MKELQSQFELNSKQVSEFLPHRAPFLFVDKILSITGAHPMDDEDPKHKLGIKVVGIKNVSINEPFFPGHFPETPVMPGVLIIETMAQVSSFSMYPRTIKRTAEGQDKFQCVLVGVEGARFRVPVVPGDVLRIETEVTSCRRFLWGFSCKGYVGEKLVAEADLLANLIAPGEAKVF